ncbi:MAG: ABC transporter substrate binding protein [Nitrosomonas ureae]
MIRTLGFFFTFMLGIGLFGSARADVLIMLSSSGGAYAEVADVLQAELQKSSIKVSVSVIGQQTVEELSTHHPQLLVTVGTKAAQMAFQISNARYPVISTLLPKTSFDNLLATQRLSDAKRFTAIYIDQPIGRQLDLVRIVLGSGRRVSVVLGPESSRNLDQMVTAAESRGLTLVAERIERSSELYPALQRLMSVSDAMVVVPDVQIANSETAQNLLLTSFRFRLPVVGYSAGYVKAGALMGVYTTPAQIGVEAGDLVRLVLKGNWPISPRFPRNFSVGINGHIARSLGLRLDTETVLKDRLQRIPD